MNFQETEKQKQNNLKITKPLAFEKMQHFNEKVSRGESIAIIQLQYNYICNMKCVHCHVKQFQQKFKNKRRMAPDDVKNLSQQADELGLARFVITGGEPLIFKDFDKIIEAIDPSKFSINIDTNAWFLNDKKAKHLKEIGVDRVQISVDSLDEQEHDNFRRKPGAHKKAVAAIDTSIKAGLSILITTVATRQRIRSGEFLNFVKYFNQQDVTIYANYPKPVGMWEGQTDILVEPEDTEYIRELEKQYNVCTHLTPGYGRNMGCGSVKDIIGITEYGDVMPCPFIHVSLGSIYDEPLQDLINKGLSIKFFGEYSNLCIMAEDQNFIHNYMDSKVFGKEIPVIYTEVFSKDDQTKTPFHITMLQENKINLNTKKNNEKLL